MLNYIKSPMLSKTFSGNNLIIFIHLICFQFINIIAVHGQFRRPDIQSFSTNDQEDLRDLILIHTDINNATIAHNAQLDADQTNNDANTRVHGGGKLFLPWHRDFIASLETFLIAQGFPQYVPLPKWNPATCIPDAFFGPNAHVQITGCDPMQGECDPPECQCPATGVGCPNAVFPYNFSQFDITSNMDICNGPFFDDAGTTGFSNRLEATHDPVHNSIGGSFATGYSPSSAIFFLWHAYLDDIYESYLCKCSNDNDGTDDHYNAFNGGINQGLITFMDFSNIPVIRAFNNFTTVGNVVIRNTSNITFFAGNRIVLEPGFETELGAIFVAEIDNCPRPGDQTPCKTGSVAGNDDPTPETEIIAPEVVVQEEVVQEEKAKEIPDNIAFEGYHLNNYPNPFSEGTIIGVYLPGHFGHSEIIVYDIIGVVVKRFALKSGHNFIEINAGDIEQGTYLYSLISAGYKIETKSMVHVK